MLPHSTSARETTLVLSSDTKSTATLAETHSLTVMKEDQQAATVTPTEPTSVRTMSVDNTVDVAASLRAKPHDDFDVTIIWHNLYADSDFITFRKESQGPIQRILVDFAKALERNVFDEVVSVNASKHLFCVTVICSKNKDEGVMDAIFCVL